MKILFVLFALTCSLTVHSLEVDEVKIYKSKHKMDLIYHGEVVKSYRVMLGRGGKSPKRKQGDNRVPEGQYVLDFKNADSKFYKSIHISYPNDEDERRAREMGVDPGGDIMIHGYPNKPNSLFKLLKKMGLIKLVDWTAGCVAVDNEEMEEIFNSLTEQTPVSIFH